MGLQPVQTVLAQCNVIRRMMNLEYKTDNEIIQELRIDSKTLYNYKRRIQDEDSKIWDLIHSDSSKFRAVQLLADLDKCRMDCLKLSEEKTISPKDRMEALKTSCEASANIFKLLNEGLTFNVSIPSDKLKTYRVSGETKEDKPKDDKDIVPVPDSEVKEDKELIPSGHEPWGLSTTRGYNHNGRDPPKKHNKKAKRTKKIVVEEDNTLQLD